MGQPQYTGADAPTSTPEQNTAVEDFIARRNAQVTPVTGSDDVSPDPVGVLTPVEDLEPIPAESTAGETAEPVEEAQ